MPTKVKLALSIVVIAVAVLMFILQRNLGNVVPGYVCLLIGSLMILGMWVFPDVRKDL